MTNTEKHTPGPWVADIGKTYIAVHSADLMHTIYIDTEAQYRRDVKAANAALIARAPDLLAQNKRLRAALENLAYRLEVDGRTADGLTKLNAAKIARAALNEKE